MEQTLQVFNFQKQDVRVILLNGEPWFVIGDACKILSIVNVGNAISRLDQDGVRQADVIDSLGREQNTVIANEPNLYRLIFRSDKPEAKPFQDWVYNEVLPTIRKTGSYSTSPVQGFDIRELIMVESQNEFNQKVRRLRKVRRALLLPAPLQTEPKTLKPKLSLREEILYQVERLDKRGIHPSAADLHNYMKPYDVSAIQNECNALVEAGSLITEKTSHTVRYNKHDFRTIESSQ